MLKLRTPALLATLAAATVACAGAASHAAPPVTDRIVVNDRVIDYSGPVTFDLIKRAQKQVLDFAAQGDEPIWFRVNSPGGSVDAGLILVDTIKSVKAPIHCVVESAAYSMAAIFLTYCDKRYALKHATIMLHEASYGMMGEDPSNRARHEFLTKYLDRMHVEIAGNIKMDVKKYRERIRDAWWLLTDEALASNIIDAVVREMAYEETPLVKTEEKRVVTVTSERLEPTKGPAIPKRRD